MVGDPFATSSTIREAEAIKTTTNILENAATNPSIAIKFNFIGFISFLENLVNHL